MFRRIYGFTENMITEHVGCEKEQLEKFYNMIDWLDVGLVIAIIFRWNSQAELPLADIALGLVSMVLCFSAFVVSRMLYNRGWISKGRFIVRLFWWPIWIPVDLIFIVLSVISLFNN